jgi:hypothetical protein
MRYLLLNSKYPEADDSFDYSVLDLCHTKVAIYLVDDPIKIIEVPTFIKNKKFYTSNQYFKSFYIPPYFFDFYTDIFYLI